MDGVATRRRSIGGGVRALARRPRASIGLAAGLVAAGLWAWWATQLWGLPDIGDPFDVAAFELSSRIPDDRNAFLVYREAAPLADRAWKAARAKIPNHGYRGIPQEWAKAGPPWRELLADGREALALWRVGSERPDFRSEYAEGLTFHTLLRVSTALQMLCRLAVLEGSRLEAEGDMAGAWGWYRAALRSSRHGGRHGLLMERTFGADMHDLASKALTRWAADPRVDAPLLRQALAEVVAIDATTAPLSDALKVEYLVFRNSLHDPSLIEDLLLYRHPEYPSDWCKDLPMSAEVKQPIQAARVLLADDRERSLRVVRLMAANWLAQVDKPTSGRPRLARVDPPIYDRDPAAPGPLSAEELGRWLDSSLLAREFHAFQAHFAPAVDRERSRQAALVAHLAEQLFRREHGGPAP